MKETSTPLLGTRWDEEGQLDEIYKSSFDDTYWWPPRSDNRRTTAWVMVTCCLSMLSFLLGYCIPNHGTNHTLGSYESGFRTEMTFPFQISLTQKQFTGTPLFNDDGSSRMPPVNNLAPWPENQTYTGPPSKELDKIWKDVWEPWALSISEEEAQSAWGEKYVEYRDVVEGGYTAGLAVFHELHCLDMIRQALHPDAYPFTEAHGEIHLEHCIESLRQSLLCSANTNLIPTRYIPGLGHNYIDADQIHTCRDIRVLRNWVDERQKPGQLYQPRIPEVWTS